MFAFIFSIYENIYIMYLQYLQYTIRSVKNKIKVCFFLKIKTSKCYALVANMILNNCSSLLAENINTTKSLLRHIKPYGK